MISSKAFVTLLRGGWRRMLLAALVAVAAVTALAQAASADVTTMKIDPTRQGWRGDLPNLKPPGFQQFNTPVSGQVYGQPLVLGNTVIVATQNDMVYGINKTTGAVTWSKSVGRAEPSSVIGCNDVNPSYGVSSTPVIDPASHTVYLTARTWDGSNAASATWRAFAFNTDTGALQPGWPITIGGTASNDPASTFDSTVENQRAGLLMLGGRVFASFGAMCDLGAYKGWISTISPGTRAVSMWVDENGSNVAAGIWQSGGALASDGTSIFASTGNGSIPAPGPGTTTQNALGMSSLRLIVDSNGNLHQADRFTPFNALGLSNDDFDMGSGGPTVLPDGFGNVPNHPHLLVQPSKTSLYLLDRDNLGGMAGPGGPDQVVSEMANQSAWSHAAVWPGDGGFFYMTDVTAGPCECAGPMKAYQVSPTGALTVAGTSNEQFGWPSGPPVVTSNGTAPGSATLWVIDKGSGQLRAYDPVPLNGRLVLRWSAPIGTAIKFSVPTTDGTSVFVGTDGHLLAYTAPQASVSTPVASSPQFGVPNQTDVFSVAPNGAVNVRWVSAGGAWGGPLAISAPGLAPPGSRLAVSNQFGLNQTDVFVVGTNGAIQVLWVSGGGAWGGPLAISPAGLAPAGAGVAASNQFGLPNQTDVFVVGTNGATQVDWVQGGGAWHGPLAISPASLAPAGAGVAASNQFGLPNQTDVFVVGTNGATEVNWVQGGGAWHGPLAISPAGQAPAGAGVAASNQFGLPNQTDVFVVGTNGATQVDWVSGGGAWHGPLAVSTPGLAPAGAGVAASNQFGLNQTDVFVVGTNGATQVDWVSGGGAWGGPLAISPAGQAPAGAGVAASNQFGLPNQTDVFEGATSGGLQVVWVSGGGPWNGPLGI